MWTQRSSLAMWRERFSASRPARRAIQRARSRSCLVDCSPETLLAFEAKQHVPAQQEERVSLPVGKKFEVGRSMKGGVPCAGSERIRSIPAAAGVM